jgi:hypothetical protein
MAHDVALRVVEDHLEFQLGCSTLVGAWVRGASHATIGGCLPGVAPFVVAGAAKGGCPWVVLGFVGEAEDFLLNGLGDDCGIHMGEGHLLHHLRSHADGRVKGQIKLKFHNLGSTYSRLPGLLCCEIYHACPGSGRLLMPCLAKKEQTGAENFHRIKVDPQEGGGGGYLRAQSRFMYSA